jgi:hypothetical protein
MTGQATARIPRAIIEDRYDGLIEPDSGAWSPLAMKLAKLLERLVAGTARVPVEEDARNALSDLAEQEIFVVIRETIIRRVDELGLAR